MLTATTLSRLTPVLALAVTSAMSRAPESIAPNDNRHAAGALSGKVLTVKLEAREGLWRPEGENGRAIPVAAFAEEGKPLSNPGPVIRVPVGTEVRATIHNTLGKPLIVSGFGKTRGHVRQRDRSGERPHQRFVHRGGARHVLLRRPAWGRTVRYAPRRRLPTQRRDRRRSAERRDDGPHLRHLVVVHARLDEQVWARPRDDGDQRALLAAHRAHRAHAG